MRAVRCPSNVIAVALLAALYLGVFLAMDGLRFPQTRDELEYWGQSVSFSGTAVPSIEMLRSYPQTTTPLTFVVWGALEHWLHQGIWLARLSNLGLSFLVVALIAAGPRQEGLHRILAAAGVLLCPYYLFVSTHVYTDMFAISLVAFGVAAHLRQRFVVGAALFVLAIASRQYMVAFPLAITVAEFVRRRTAMRPARAWLAPAVATLSLAAWYLFFGSPGPSEEVARQGIPAVPHPTLVRNALYMLACVGLYFALPARLLYRRPFQWRDVASPRAGAVAAGLLVLFVLFPPLRNEGVPVATMGLFDRMLHLAGLNGAGRVAVFYLVALGALHDLRRSRLALALVAGNAFVMMGAQFIWDKYAVPLIVVLWYLESRRMPGVAGECEAGADRAG